MIGVIANLADTAVVAEFFELFKTPWEPYRPGQQYETVLCAREAPAALEARLVVRYGSSEQAADEGRQSLGLPRQESGRLLTTPRGPLPLYGEGRAFPGEAERLPRDAAGPIGYVERRGQTTQLRAGYDLFAEVRTLLTKGQPEERAAIPALELHIDLLREWMTASGAAWQEVRPAPEGHRFLAALTHDVDHPSLRRHGLDHTAAGFLYRALAGSLRDAWRGRLRGGEVAANWWAAAKFPLVLSGLAKDFWLDFVRYPECERGRPSTFFVIPFAGEPGRHGTGRAPRFRAAAYGAADIAPQLAELQRRGCETGVHGLDAWLSADEAARERAALRDVTGAEPEGVRMHWLYFDEGSHAELERAGFAYDSTIGYNGTVGFRAGTAQAYRPLGAENLLELPLIVMDTALFYPSHLNLSREEAWARVQGILDQAEQFGGCVTINWHDRSLSPERQWGGFYQDLVAELERRGAWITTAGGAVEWFRRRRAATPIRPVAAREEALVPRD